MPRQFLAAVVNEKLCLYQDQIYGRTANNNGFRYGIKAEKPGSQIWKCWNGEILRRAVVVLD